MVFLWLSFYFQILDIPVWLASNTAVALTCCVSFVNFVTASILQVLSLTSPWCLCHFCHKIRLENVILTNCDWMTDKAIYTDAIASKNKPYNEVSGAAQLTGLEFCINIIRNLKSCYIYFTTQCTVVYRYVHVYSCEQQTAECTLVCKRVYIFVQERVQF